MGADLVEGVHVALEDVLVLLALHGRELRVHDELGLGRDARLDVDLVEIYGRYRGDVREIQGRCKGDVGEI